MHEPDRLKRTLEQAVGEADDVPLNGPVEVLARILDEIDMVVLPRDVTFENEAGQSLSVIVKSRRLIRINSPLPDVPGATPTVVDAELGSDPQHMTAVAHLIAGFAAQATQLSTSLADAARPDVLTDVGISVAQLRGALEDAGYTLPAQRDDIIATLSSMADAQGLTWVRFKSGELDASKGQADALNSINETIVPYILKSDRPAKGRVASWMLGTRGGQGAKARISITSADDTVFVAAIPPDLTHDWITACAGRTTG